MILLLQIIKSNRVLLVGVISYCGTRDGYRVKNIANLYSVLMVFFGPCLLASLRRRIVSGERSA